MNQLPRIRRRLGIAPRIHNRPPTSIVISAPLLQPLLRIRPDLIQCIRGPVHPARPVALVDMSKDVQTGFCTLHGPEKVRATYMLTGWGDFVEDPLWRAVG